MRYGLSMPNFGEGIDAAAIAVLARDAEKAGWDGFFLWDHLLAFTPGPVPVVDPWIALTAAAMNTRSNPGFFLWRNFCANGLAQNSRSSAQ